MGRMRQRYEENLETVVEERLQQRLALKREKMSEVMNNFLHQFGNAPQGIDVAKIRGYITIPYTI